MEIIATFYDDQGRVVGSAFSFANPHTLDPGQKAPFNILWVDLLAGLVKRYSLQVEFRRG